MLIFCVQIYKKPTLSPKLLTFFHYFRRSLPSSIDARGETFMIYPKKDDYSIMSKAATEVDEVKCSFDSA